MSTPLVTAVMVTGKDARRYALARASLRSFLNQDWPQRELVIINDGLQWVLEGHADGRPMKRYYEPALGVMVSEYRLPPDGTKTLGDLRNLGLSLANGEWVCQWDDDDWFGDQRISAQMQHRLPAHAVLFLRQVRCSLKHHSAFVYTGKSHEGIHGSVLHPRVVTAQYESIGKHEDSHFLNSAFGERRIIIDADPMLHVRLHHDCNTWHDTHIMGRYATDKAGRWALAPGDAKHLKQVLVENYGYQK